MSDAEQIRQSYDVSNEFFRLFLDEGMNYSCALFEPGDTLEAAQARKLAWLCDAAAITVDSYVIDVGCGWGGNLEYLVRRRGVRRAHGLTLSAAQHRLTLERHLDGVEVTLGSYVDFEPREPFDAVESIGMLEHVCTPADARAGRAVEVLRDYFRRVHGWTRPGARFALQSIVRVQMPRLREDVRDLGWVGEFVFPGAMTPRLEQIVAAAAPYWEVLEVRTRRAHYAMTCRCWQERLRARESEVRSRFGEALFERYDRYLGISARMFERHYTSLAQLSLRRMDETERPRRTP
jgi:cyclopropane-fatty-acyl-phospholipid synthase